MAYAGLRKELLCSICLKCFTDPVTLRCGHNFCWICIDQVLNAQDEAGGYSCPECREEFQERPGLKRNITLCNVVENILSSHRDCVDSPVPAVKSCLMCESSGLENVLTEPRTSLRNKKCSVHNELLNYYCTEDAVCICLSCLFEEHQGHEVEVLDEASEKKKKQLIKVLPQLITWGDEIEKRVKKLQEARRKNEGKASRETKRITALFKGVRKQLDDLEKRILSDVSRKEDLVSRSQSDELQKLETIKVELSKKMRDIVELCNTTDPLTVLMGPETGDLCDSEEEEGEEETGDVNDSEEGEEDTGDVNDPEEGEEDTSDVNDSEEGEEDTGDVNDSEEGEEDTGDVNDSEEGEDTGDVNDPEVDEEVAGDVNDPEEGEEDTGDVNDPEEGEEDTGDVNDPGEGEEDTSDVNDPEEGEEDTGDVNDPEEGEEDTGDVNDPEEGEEDTGDVNDSEEGEDTGDVNDPEVDEEVAGDVNDPEEGEEETGDVNDPGEGEEDTGDVNDPGEGEEDTGDVNDPEEGEEDTGDVNDPEEGEEDTGDLCGHDEVDWSVELISHISHTLSSLKRYVVFHAQDPADILLDVNTAGDYILISDDLKTTTWTARNQSRPKTAERFTFRQVMSRRGFTSGRHYWDVEISGSGWWRVGMCYPSIDRRGSQSYIGDNNKSWGLYGGQGYNHQCSVMYDSKEIFLGSRISSDRVRIYVDYEAGELTFYELCDPIRHIYTFTAHFTEPLHAALCVWEGYLNILG